MRYPAPPHSSVGFFGLIRRIETRFNSKSRAPAANSLDELSGDRIRHCSRGPGQAQSSLASSPGWAGVTSERYLSKNEVAGMSRFCGILKSVSCGDARGPVVPVAYHGVPAALDSGRQDFPRSGSLTKPDDCNARIVELPELSRHRHGDLLRAGRRPQQQLFVVRDRGRGARM